LRDQDHPESFVLYFESQQASESHAQVVGIQLEIRQNLPSFDGISSSILIVEIQNDRLVLDPFPQHIKETNFS
jgi:hypothetical protein